MELLVVTSMDFPRPAFLPGKGPDLTPLQDVSIIFSPGHSQSKREHLLMKCHHDLAALNPLLNIINKHS